MIITKQWSNGDLLTLDTSAGSIAVSSVPNNTGADREMTVQVQTANAGTKVTENLLVRQAKNPNDGYWTHRTTGVKTYFGLDASWIAGTVFNTPTWKNDASEINIPEGITELSAGALNNSPNLLRLVTPSTLLYFRDNAFSNCLGIVYLALYATTPPALGAIANIGAAGIQVKVPAASVNTYKTAPVWLNFAAIISAL